MKLRNRYTNRAAALDALDLVRCRSRPSFYAAAAVAGRFTGASLLPADLAQAASGGAFSRPTHSSPIAMSADNTLVWSVNPGDDSVSVICTGTNVPVANIKVGDEPESVALDPSNSYAYVANAASSVTVIKIKNASSFSAEVDRQAGKNSHITTGAEPWNIVASPDGKRVFVANSGQDTITVIDAKLNKIIGHVDVRNSLSNDPNRDRRFQPRGLAVTQDNTKLYVTRFANQSLSKSGA